MERRPPRSRLVLLRILHWLRLLAPLAALAAGAVAALLLLSALHALLPREVQADASGMAAVHGWSSPAMTALMLALTGLGAIASFVSAAAVVVVLLWSWRRRHAAAVLGTAILGALALNDALKLHFRRLRPDVPWRIGHEPTFSFPSGHALFAITLYGTLLYLALQSAARLPRRVSLVLTGVLLPVGIGLSRIYLGMHFPTDVVAGYVAGGCWLTGVIAADRLWRERGRQPSPGERATPAPAPSRRPRGDSSH